MVGLATHVVSATADVPVVNITAEVRREVTTERLSRTLRRHAELYVVPPATPNESQIAQMNYVRNHVQHVAKEQTERAVYDQARAACAARGGRPASEGASFDIFSPALAALRWVRNMHGVRDTSFRLEPVQCTPIPPYVSSEGTVRASCVARGTLSCHLQSGARTSQQTSSPRSDPNAPEAGVRVPVDASVPR